MSQDRALAATLSERSLRLSILDFGYPLNSLTIAQAADKLGYYRYWIGEHHSYQQCANPLLLSSFLGSITQAIRLGTGAICLGYRSPYLVAEDAHLVGALIPERFDIGVTRGLPLDDALLFAIRDGYSHSPLGYDEKLHELHGFLTGRLSNEHPLCGRPLGTGSSIPMWLLGVGVESARWAARSGIGFCFSLHHAPEGCDGPSVVEEYRNLFTPSPEFSEASVIIVASGVCAKSTNSSSSPLSSQALSSWKAPTFQGDPDFCVEEIERIAEAYRAKEMMIIDMLHSNTDLRLKMYADLAVRFRLDPR